MATRNQIITRAFQRIGEYSAGEAITASDVDTAANALNDVVSELAAEGLQLWQLSTVSFTPVEGQASYTIGPSGADITAARPLTVHQAWIQVTSGALDTELVKISRDEYNRLSPKSQKGVPNQFYYQPTLTSGTLYLFPTADANTVSTRTIKLDIHSAMDTFTAAGSEQDFPPEQTRFLTLALAMELADIYGTPSEVWQRVNSAYMVSYDRIMAGDSEQTGVLFRPSRRMTMRNR